MIGTRVRLNPYKVAETIKFDIAKSYLDSLDQKTGRVIGHDSSLEYDSVLVRWDDGSIDSWEPIQGLDIIRKERLDLI